MAQYQKPPFIISKIANPLMITAVTKLGIRPGGMAVLAVKGRKTGRLNRVPLNPVDVGGSAYLLSPRGTSQWVQNVRAAGGKANLYLGRALQPVALTEVDDSEKLPIVREYVTKFYSAVGKIMNIPKNPSDDQLRAVLANHPVFRIENA
ncbi:MAG: nitroreductase/quinone reductase family protein [Thermomicrobiales bacterium]